MKWYFSYFIHSTCWDAVIFLFFNFMCYLHNPCDLFAGSLLQHREWTNIFCSPIGTRLAHKSWHHLSIICIFLLLTLFFYKSFFNLMPHVLMYMLISMAFIWIIHLFIGCRGLSSISFTSLLPELNGLLLMCSTPHPWNSSLDVFDDPTNKRYNYNL